MDEKKQFTSSGKENLVNNTDETLLLVSGSKGDKEGDKKYVKVLANAILQVFAKHGLVRLRCVGAASVNNAVKSFILAKGDSDKKGDKIYFDPSFTSVQFQGETKTAIVFEVKRLV